MTQRFFPGEDNWYASDSPTTSFSGVFEDDGTTGYFYACDRAEPEDWILDACHLYDVAAVTDRSIPSEVQILWSADGLKAALLLNGHPHAVADFSRRIAWCRSNFPPPAGPWAATTRQPWREDLMALFE